MPSARSFRVSRTPGSGGGWPILARPRRPPLRVYVKHSEWLQVRRSPWRFLDPAGGRWPGLGASFCNPPGPVTSGEQLIDHAGPTARFSGAGTSGKCYDRSPLGTGPFLQGPGVSGPRRLNPPTQSTHPCGTNSSTVTINSTKRCEFPISLQGMVVRSLSGLRVCECIRPRC